jgi:DNA modification methylase
MTWRLYRQDCLDMLAELDDASADACVCDPPYGLGKPPPIEKVLAAWLAGEKVEVKGGGFMGAEWDAFVPGPRYWREVARVLKPGGHAVVFAGQRTIDVMGIALRLAGLEVRDLLGWQYWSGFPKSLDVSKAIDRAAGAEREVVGPRIRADGTYRNGAAEWAAAMGYRGNVPQVRMDTAPATPDAKRWEGWGTALKPCIEPALLVRKPLSGTVAASVLAHGTGALNIDGCRYAFGDPAWPGPQVTGGDWWPANVYACPKASTAERERGCDGLPAIAPTEVTGRKEGSAGQAHARAGMTGDRGRRNIHPTVKPVRLLRWLVRLVTPPQGTVIDPFAGSGSCGVAAVLEGVAYIGAELGERYQPIAEARIGHAARFPEQWLDTRPGPPVTEHEQERADIEAAGQGDLFGSTA